MTAAQCTLLDKDLRASRFYVNVSDYGRTLLGTFEFKIEYQSKTFFIYFQTNNGERKTQQLRAQSFYNRSAKTEVFNRESSCPEVRLKHAYFGKTAQ